MMASVMRATQEARIAATAAGGEIASVLLDPELIDR